MDTARDAEEYDAMDFTEADTAFAVDALALLEGRTEASVLDVGTGTAKIPLLMLDRCPSLDILAVDLSAEMLRVAARNASRSPHGARCRFARLDGKAMRLPDARFDLVMCNSTVHHIPDPFVLFSEMARVVKPDGAIIVRDLARPRTMDDAWKIVKRVAAGEHIRQQQLFFDSLCAALTVAEVKEIVQRAKLGRVSVRTVSDRHWSAERRAARAAK